MRRFSLTLAAAALVLVSVGSGRPIAQGNPGDRIDKVANHRLTGNSYASVRGVSYQQCARRCLADQQCKALEHIRGNAATGLCRLFSSFGGAHVSQNADVGYKRLGQAAQKPQPPVSSPAPKATVPAPAPHKSELKGKAAVPHKGGPEPKATSAPPSAPPKPEGKTKTYAMKKSGPPPSGPPSPPSTAPTPPPSSPRQESSAPPPSAPPPPPVATAPPAPPPVAPPTSRGAGATEESAKRSLPAPESARTETGPGAPSSTTPAPTTRSAAPSATPAPNPDNPAVAPGASPSTDWDVVPVFYGTDRGRRDLPKRIGYGTDRGHKLEVGRALVTVPKAHQVPNVERPWAIRIPYTSVVLYQQDEDPKKHFTIQEIKALSRDELLAFIRERLRASRSFQDQALVFVHGYNNRFDDALFRTAQIAYDLKYDGAPFLYSWPSGSGIAGYPYDSNSAQQAEPFFTQFLMMVLKETGAKNVSIIAHSMGNQLLLQTLRNLDRSNPEIARINQIILAAPDVDRDAFQFLAAQIRDVGRGITLYASSNDMALGISRRYAGGIPRAGDVPAGLGPIVVSGVDTIDVSALSTEYLSLNHSSYAEKTGLLKDIELVLRSGVRPPEVRLPLLERVTLGQGVYWRYPK